MLAPDGAAGDRFGRIVATHQDTIVVGALEMMTTDLAVDQYTSSSEVERSGPIKPSCWRQVEHNRIGSGRVSQFTGVPLLLALLETMTTDQAVDQHTSLFHLEGWGVTTRPVGVDSSSQAACSSRSIR